MEDSKWDMLEKSHKAISRIYSIELGLTTIETLLNNGMTVWASGENIRYKSEEGINKADKDLLLQILKGRKPDVLPLISDPEATRKTLCEAQEALSEAINHAKVLLEVLEGHVDIPKGKENAV